MVKNSIQMMHKNFPKELFALIFIQVFSTLSYSILYSTLVLFLTEGLSLDPSYSNSLMGVFIAFNYALHLLGGYWGGRYFSYRDLFCLGMVFQIMGCLLLASVSTTYLYIALALFLTGAGVNVTCINCMITQLFKPDDSRRENAFLLSYSAMNIGFFVGFGLSGYFQLTRNYHYLFLCSSLGNGLALVICCYYWKLLADKETIYATATCKQRKAGLCIGVSLLMLVPFLLYSLLNYAEFANTLILMSGIALPLYIFYLAQNQTARSSRRKMHAFIILLFVNIVFSTLYQIAPMGITQFIAHNVDRHIMGMIIPPQWFQTINTLCIIVGGPVIALCYNALRQKGYKISIPPQFASALLLIGLAFTLLPLGIYYANAEGWVNSYWLLIYFILQSIAELLISPIGYAMIGTLIPAPLQGLMMGIWMLSTGVGAALASYSSNFMVVGGKFSPLLTNTNYSQSFLVLGLVTIVFAMLLYALSPIIKKWIEGEALVVEKSLDTLLPQ